MNNEQELARIQQGPRSELWTDEERVRFVEQRQLTEMNQTMMNLQQRAKDCVTAMGDIFHDHDTSTGESDPHIIAVAEVLRALEFVSGKADRPKGEGLDETATDATNQEACLVCGDVATVRCDDRWLCNDCNVTEGSAR